MSQREANGVKKKKLKLYTFPSDGACSVIFK